jgi:hypothetical protein
MQIQGVEHSGQDDRSNAWLFTCDRWAEYDTYIQLPINPQSMDYSQPLRGTTGETINGRFMYVFRNPKSKSVFKPCNYSFEIPSGCILPEFNIDYIRSAQQTATEYGTQVMSARPDQDTGKGMGFARFNEAEQQAQRDRVISMDRYRAGERARMEELFSDTTPNVRGDHLANKRFRKYVDGTFESMSSKQAAKTSRQSTATSKTNPTRNIPPLYRSDIPVTLQNLWAFMSLFDEQKTFVDMHGVLRNNRIIVHMSTLLYPSLTMYGWPDPSGLKFGESADAPEITLSFDLFVTATVPVMGYMGSEGAVEAYRAHIATPTESLDRLRLELASHGEEHKNNNLGTVKRV